MAHLPRLSHLFNVFFHLAQCFFVLVLLCNVASAEGLELTDLVLDNEKGIVRLRFGVNIADTTEIKEVLEESGKIELRCKAHLERKRMILWNKTLADSAVISTLTKDSLSGMYQISFPGTGTEIREHTDLKVLLAEGWERLSIDMGLWMGLQRNNEYRVSLSVELERVEVPSWIRTTLFFWSWDVAPRNVFDLNFSY